MRFAFIMLGALATCPAVAGPQPTATEIFHLRTECIKLGKELMKEYEKDGSINFLISKYDENSNRCYAHILYFYKDTSRSISLYDAQGGGLIAEWSKSYGTIKGENVSPELAYDYIEYIMKDNMGEKN
jgi:hypothetical protein